MENYNINPFTKFAKDWALVTAGVQGNFNSMTISWGAMGTIWHKNTITIYIRPSRYTFQFLQNNDYFTVAFFNDEYKKALGVMGSLSGRDKDKVRESGLKPRYLDKAVTYEEAQETFVCKKIYMAALTQEGMLPEYQQEFEQEDVHYIIIGEVVDKL